MGHSTIETAILPVPRLENPLGPVPSVDPSAPLQQPAALAAGGSRGTWGQRALQLLRARWRGRRPEAVAYGWFLPDEVLRLHTALQAEAPSAAPALDEATWRDLELGRYLDALARHTSLFGRQLLVHRLRCSAALAPEERLWARLQQPQSDAELDAAWAALQPLRSVDTDLAGPLFVDAAPVAPAWVRHLWAVPAAFVVVGALLALGQVAAGVLLGLATLGVSAWAQIVLHGPLQLWQRQRGALRVMLQAAQAATAAAPGRPGALLQTVQDQATTASPLLRALGPGWADRIPALAEYANLLALTQYRSWGRDLARWPAWRPGLRQVFLAVAGLEADLTLRGHLRHGPATCAAQPAAGRRLAFVDLVHPLLDEPHPLSLALDGQGAFITGQNGAGKSTLLRSVGLNVVVGQAFGFCYARQAQVPRLAVCSSLQIEDSLGTATSLYMAELERARWLCRMALEPGGALLLVDEIFRGTNPQESMAATAALAQELAATALLLMATHHRSLAPGLAPALLPWCVERDADGVQALRPGVLERTNGLAMLADYGFSPALRAEAERVFEQLQSEAGRGRPAGA
jgi:hypothetical protein